MNALEVVGAYFEAWSARDPLRVVAAFDAHGTHEDPASGGPIGGERLGRHAAGLFAAFPDLSFELVSAAQTGESTVAAQWCMSGTNSAPLMGGPPTQRSISLRGADFIAVSGDKITSVQRYFDQKTFIDQLGLQMSVQNPFPMESVQYGNSAYMSVGKPVRPEAISLTWIVPRNEQEREKLRGRIQQIMQDMPKTPGFLSMMLAGCANKLFTSAAWSDAKAPEQMAPRGAHLEAMQDFWKGDLGAFSMTSIWVPVRINGPHVRCTSCDQMSDYSRNEGRCGCGTMLPDPPPYW
jgi:steroid delta-isomerase-like uncharacterized protein